MQLDFVAEVCFHRSKTTVPSELTSILDEKTFTKSRVYAIDRNLFGEASGLFSQLVSTVILLLTGYKFVWDVAGNLVEGVLGYDDARDCETGMI